MNKINRSLISWLILLPIVSAVLFPLFVVFSTSIKPENELTKMPPDYFPSTAIWSNFLDVWQQTNIGQALFNSFTVSFSATFIAILISAPCAYALTRFDFKGKKAYQFFLLVTQMLSPIVLVLGLFRLMVELELMNSLSFLAVIYAAFNVAFCVWMLQSYFNTIPKDLEESAWLEGASTLRSLLTIFMPLATPALAIVSMFTFINSWNEFIIAFSTLRDSSSYTVQIAITEMLGYYSVPWDYVMITIIMSTLPIAILFTWLQKHLVSGLSQGAVK